VSFHDSTIGGVRVPRWIPEDPGAAANFGDEIGPLLVAALAGDAVAPAGARLLSVGSVIHFAEPGDVVWGAGVNGKVRQRVRYPLDVRAVRGPLTRAVLLGSGVPTPEVFGDPALLLPRLLPDVEPAGAADVLVVPNLNELDRVGGEGVLSPLGDPLDIASRIRAATFVVASSLHALVLADAYGVPSRPLVPAAEHPFKYLDYYAGTGRADVRFASSVEEALELGPVAPPEVDLDALEAAFPRDLWEGGPRPVDRTSRHDARLRAEGARAQAALALAVGRDAPDAAAQALLRTAQLAAEQPAHLVDLLAASSEGSAAPGDEIARLLGSFLRANPARGDIDQRVAKALARALAERRTPDVVARVAATGKVSLARAIATGEEPPASGEAFLADREREQAPEPAPPRGILSRLRGRRGSA